MTCSVLVVEDDAPIRKGMVALLRIHGHHVDAVATVAEALSHVEASLPTHVLLDLNLPDAPGTDVLRLIRVNGL